jgi:cytochrome c-type biogenesis protein CcmH/NrfG
VNRFVARNPRILRLTIVVVILVGVAAGLLWGKRRLVPDLAAEARAALARRDWKGTERLARQRLKQAPGDPQALQLAARAAAFQDRDQAAIDIYSRLILEDMDAEDLYLLGRALGRTGKVELAFKTLERARLTSPDHPETLDALAQLFLRNDRENAAEEAAERLVRRPGWEARGLLILGTARAELHDPAGSAEALRRFFEVDPPGQAAAPRPVRPFRLLLARSLLRVHRAREARQVVANLPENEADAEASWLLCRAYIQEHDWARAESLLGPSAAFRALNPVEAEPAPYVGAARCAACHPAIYRSLMASKHATTFSRARDLDKLVLPSNPVADPGNPEVTHEYTRRDGSVQVETRVGEEVQRAVIDYAFGSRGHFMTFVGRDDERRSRMLRISHVQSGRDSGWDLSTGLPKRPENSQEYLGTVLLEGDGVRRCLFCHTTNFRAVLDQTGPEAADLAIGCERCHGPGGHHVAAVEAGFPDPAIVNPGRLAGPAVNKTCGQCHDLHNTNVISAPRTDPVWYRFQSLALTWSRCYTESEGNLTCLTCHDPHSDTKATATHQVAKCLSCHGPDQAPAGTSHSPVSAALSQKNSSQRKKVPRKAQTTCPVESAKGCIECHMPKAYQQSTHSFKTDHFIRVRDRLTAVK